MNKILTRIYQRVGSLYIFLGDEAAKKNEPSAEPYAQAVGYHEKSLASAEKLYRADENNLPNRRRYAISLINLSETLAKNSQRDETKIETAHLLLQKTVDEDPHNLEAKRDLAEVNRIESEIKLRFGDKTEAIRYLEIALELFKKSWQTDGKNEENLQAIINAHKKLAELYETENQPQKALFHKRELEKITQPRNQNSPKS